MNQPETEQHRLERGKRKFERLREEALRRNQPNRRGEKRNADLTTKDPETGLPWNLADKSIQRKVKQLIKDTEPYCIVGSPPCTAFSPLQELS